MIIGSLVVIFSNLHKLTNFQTTIILLLYGFFLLMMDFETSYWQK